MAPLPEDDGRIMALRALAQVIAKGSLSKDEGRVIAEFLPNVFHAIADYRRLSFAGLMRNLNDGPVSARVVVQALMNMRGQRLDGSLVTEPRTDPLEKNER